MKDYMDEYFTEQEQNEIYESITRSTSFNISTRDIVNRALSILDRKHILLDPISPSYRRCNCGCKSEYPLVGLTISGG